MKEKSKIVLPPPSRVCARFSHTNVEVIVLARTRTRARERVVVVVVVVVVACGRIPGDGKFVLGGCVTAAASSAAVNE